MSHYDFNDASNSYYEATVSRPLPAPPLTGHHRFDVAVVGGGYSGLSTALELASRGYSVGLFEAKVIGWGASGRNGGQVIVGYAGTAAIERQFSRADARQAWDLSVEAVALLGERIQRHHIQCDYIDGHLSLATTRRKSRALSQWVEHVANDYDYELKPIPAHEIGDWIQSARYLSGAYDPRSGHLHPLKYCLGLAEAARAAGVSIFENDPVRKLTWQGRQPRLTTSRGQVTAEYVVLAGNAYLADYGRLADALMRRILLVGTFMIATEPLAPDLAQGLVQGRAAAADTNFILDYFRVTADNRLLFGGADAFSARRYRNIIPTLRGRIRDVFPQIDEPVVSHGWGGIVDASLNNAPDFGRLGPQVYYLQGFSGHGVALANLAGTLVAEAIAGQAERFDLLARIEHFEFPRNTAFRRASIELGILYHRLHDRLG